MNFIFLDTETTGLIQGKDEVVQLSMLITDENLKLLRCKSFYCHTTRIIDKRATAVTSLTNEKVTKWSKGWTLEDYVRADPDFYYRDDTVFVGYNIGFDVGMINYTLMSNGCKPLNFGQFTELYVGLTNKENQHMDIMSKLSRELEKKPRVKQSYLVSKYLGKEFVDREFSRIFKCESGDFHDSLYDTFCTFLLFKKFRSYFML